MASSREANIQQDRIVEHIQSINTQKNTIKPDKTKKRGQMSNRHAFPFFSSPESKAHKVTRTTIQSGMSSNFNQIGLLTVEVAALERLEKSRQTNNGRNVLTTLVPSFLNGSS